MAQNLVHWSRSRVQQRVSGAPLACYALPSKTELDTKQYHSRTDLFQSSQVTDTMKTMFFTQNVEQLVIDVNQLQSLHRYTENKVR